MDDWQKLLLAGVIGYFSAFAVQWWKASRDDFREVIKDLCKLIDRIAEVGSKCWLSGPTDPERQLLESQTLGLQERMLGLQVSAFRRFSRSQRQEQRDQVLSLMNALTGDEFNVTGRPVRPDLARAVHLCAAHTIVSTMRALSVRLTIKGAIASFLRL